MTRHHHDTTQMDWAEMAPMLERGAELGTPVYRQAAAWLGELAPPASVRRILDVGSGPGVLTTLLAEAFPYAEVVAVDATPPLLERARARAERLGLADRVQTRHAELPGDIDTLGEADLIWSGNALHHIGDQRAALAGLARRLRPGGLVALVEGGLTERHLPRDIGLGRPGLESRLEAVRAEWFAEMRAELPGFARETEDWRALLAAAGLTPSGARSFLLDIPAPVTPVVREYLHTFFTRSRTALEGRLADDDIAALDRLLDPEDPQGLARRPDAYLLAAHTVHTARRG
ncbi:class I SAM-dependent methyltransferase [Streptomyces sp. PR69]|uniref:class I SAM-dependent methyltransferase n=1 Tax=Streptomyces sp. PR69 TaxID=2984950 RepID=UPI002264B62B|nr:class I SAM-dependent methyltransferase [Streptomyces sp. PR69]